MTRLSVVLPAILKRHLETGQAARVPDFGRIVWNAFAALSQARQWHSHGPQPISFPEVQAWASANRLPLEPHHVEAIRALDAVWLEHARKPKETPQPSGRGMTADLFDALGF